MVEQGAAQLLPQDRTSPQQLAEALWALCQDRAQLLAMAAASRRLGRPAAADAIAERVLKLATHRP
jgi:UDP-N-acetylglucosamine--N-acetylmuramyl-(pentapeptide) pyrophosphoryl-undecaprenol N-acetylglucosamine transferase